LQQTVCYCCLARQRFFRGVHAALRTCSVLVRYQNAERKWLHTLHIRIYLCICEHTLCICVYAYMYDVCICMSVYIYYIIGCTLYIHTYTHIVVYTYAYIYRCICMYICMCTSVCLYYIKAYLHCRQQILCMYTLFGNMQMYHLYTYCTRGRT